MTICSVEDCGKKHHSQGLCGAHYMHQKRHGDPFGGRTSRGEPMRFIEEVALSYAGEDCLPWQYAKNENGSAQVWVNGRVGYAARYICTRIHGEPPTPEHQASHACGKAHEGCVNPRHLSWKTPKENNADKLIHGTLPRGERHVKSKLTENEVREIRSLRGVETQAAIAKRFAVTFQAVSKIHTGQSWAHLGLGPPRARAALSAKEGQ